MTEVDFQQITSYQRYKLMASLIVPRPIALVTTLGANGVVNAVKQVGLAVPLVVRLVQRLQSVREQFHRLPNAARLVDAAALEALRAKLKSSDDAVLAMTLALEEQRKRAEEALRENEARYRLLASLSDTDRAELKATRQYDKKQLQPLDTQTLQRFDENFAHGT